MSFLAPFALTLLGVIPISILLVHLLRGRRPRVAVPATFLWAGLPCNVGGKGRWRMPPLSLLLLLQLVAATAIALALARPAAPLDPLPRHIAIVLDASASMRARDAIPSRFDEARERALERLDSLESGDHVTVIRAGIDAEVVADGAPDQVREALAVTQPGAGSGALREALAVASSHVAATPEREGEIVVFTDGAFDALVGVGPLSAPVDFERVTTTAGTNNQAIVDVQMRLSSSSRRGGEMLIRVANYDEEPIQRPIRISDAMSGQLIDSVVTELPATNFASVVIGLPEGVQRLSIELGESPRDVLDLDDAVVVAAPVENAGPYPVVLVSDAPETLQRALNTIPWIQLSVVAPDEYAAQSLEHPETTLTIFDGVLPDRLPDGPLLIVNPPAGNSLLPVTHAVTTGVTTEIDESHPLLTGIDARALRVEGGPALRVPDWARSVAASAAGPLILDGRLAGYPAVVYAFAPSGSSLEKSIAFPLLMRNTVAYLLADGSRRYVRPGDVVTMPAVDGVVLVRPDGGREQVTILGGEAQFRPSGAVGRYMILEPQQNTVISEFWVNLLDARESDIRPTADLAPLAASVTRTSTPEQDQQPPMAEWWRVVVVAAAGLLGLEWLVFARRG